jgi:uncharacterized protein with PIN domain
MSFLETTGRPCHKVDIKKCKLCKIVVMVDDDVINPHVQLTHSKKKSRIFYVCNDCKQIYKNEYNNKCYNKPDLVIDYY